ncbi:hypothetical protein HY632_05425 [Candidatus Uhrbacteria bacterium]|nr:hypothetical protein [Candidatus Uhrbacteria bacterium]
MHTTKLAEWILRVAVAGEFFGHGVFAIQGKATWIGWVESLLRVDTATATTLLTVVGWTDIAIALLVLCAPVRAVLLWAAAWGFWTALVRPIMGDPVWDFIERWANWGAPLALLFLRGWPRNIREWFR